MSFSANCKTRGLLAELMEPKEPELRLAFGLAKCGELSRLKLSARNCRLLFSKKDRLLIKEKSSFQYPGPRTRFRPASPGTGWPLLCPGVLVNASVLNHSEIVRLCRGSVGVWPGTRFGRKPG